jgi:hypothetical protein
MIKAIGIKSNYIFVIIQKLNLVTAFVLFAPKNYMGIRTGRLIAELNLVVSSTNREKLPAQKTCDIIIPVSLVSGADSCFYVGILCQAFFSKLYILTSAQLQMLLLATAYRECCLCENGPLLSSSEHRHHFRGRFSPCFTSRTQRLLITQKTACFP